MPKRKEFDAARVKVIDGVAGAVLAPIRAIEQKYRELGGAAAWGEPIRKEMFLWTFASSCIAYDADSDRAFEIHGAIYQKWLEWGGLGFGVPNTDELTCPDGVGRFNHFNGGTASIYWSPQTGAHTIFGAIRQRWSELGWEQSYLGYPTSDEVDFAEGGRANEFQNGGIYWWPDTGAIDLRDVVVHYTGLVCFGETDWDQSSDADEPYAIIGATAPHWKGTHRTRVYRGVDGGEARPDLLEIYRGRPYGLNLSTIVMEWDFGDPDKFREEVQVAVDAAHGIGTAALGLIPVVGPFIAAVAGPALGRLMPKVGTAINDLLDTDDDRIGQGDLTISARELVLLATRTPKQEFKGIGWKRDTPLVSGHGASYKAYFGVVPA